MSVTAILALLLVTCCSQLHAFIQDLHYESKDAFVDANIYAFGMAEGGVIDVTYNVSTTNTVDDPSTSFLLIVVAIMDQYNTWYTRLENVDYTNPLYYQDVQDLCVMPSMYRKQLYPSEGSFQFVVTATDQYDVLVLQCFPQHSPLVADLKVELLNPTSEGCCTSHLPIDSVMAINIAIIETFFYSIMVISFATTLYMAESQSIKPMHYIMLLTVCISVLSSFLDYVGNSAQNDTGKIEHGLAVTIYLIHIFESISFKFTILLLGMGWNFVRQHIAQQEKSTMILLCIFFVVIGVSQIPCLGVESDSLSSGCQALALTEYVLAGLMLLGTLIALNYSVSQLRAIISNLNWYAMMPVLYARLKQYNQFRNMFLALLIVPTIIYMVEITVLTWKQKWIGDLIQAMVKMAFICYIGAIFIPLDSNLLCRSFNGSFNTG